MNRQLKTKNHIGFTIIETLVVVGILSTAGLVVVQLFFSMLKSGSKSTVTTIVEQNGDYALTVMGRMIQNSREVITCGATSLTIKNPDDKETTFICDQSASPVRIASNSAIGNYPLTSTGVAISCTSLFDCSQLTTGRRIGISFDVSQNIPNSKLEETAQIHFQTNVTVRNY